MQARVASLVIASSSFVAIGGISEATKPQVWQEMQSPVGLESAESVREVEGFSLGVIREEKGRKVLVLLRFNPRDLRQRGKRRKKKKR